MFRFLFVEKNKTPRLIIRLTTRNDMSERITNAIRSISQREIEMATQSTLQRILACVENNERHFEHLRNH